MATQRHGTTFCFFFFTFGVGTEKQVEVSQFAKDFGVNVLELGRRRLAVLLVGLGRGVVACPGACVDQLLLQVLHSLLFASKGRAEKQITIKKDVLSRSTKSN
jgi:hypothetical protein